MDADGGTSLLPDDDRLHDELSRDIAEFFLAVSSSQQHQVKTEPADQVGHVTMHV